MSSPLKLLVDVSAGEAIANWLAAAGHDTVSVRNLDPRMPDIDILARAVSEQRIVVTMDKDFGELVYRSGLPHSGGLLLRLEDADTAEKLRVIEDIFTRFGDHLAGHFSVFQNGQLRIR